MNDMIDMVVDIEVERILNLTDEEVLQECKKRGEDLKAIELHYKTLFMQAALNLADNECLRAQEDLSEEWIGDANLHLIKARRHLSTLRNVLKDLK